MTTSGSSRPPGGHAQNGVAQSSPNRSNRSATTDVAHYVSAMRAQLNKTIEGEIVPRLMLAFNNTSARAEPVSAPRPITEADIKTFIHLTVNQNARAAADHVSLLRSQGATLSSIYTDLLSPSAQRLGVLWETDELTFSDVTIGICHMHQVLLEFSRCFDAPGAALNGKTCLIAPVPGEQHTFGLYIIIEFLRQAGWNCWTAVPTTHGDLRRLVQSRHFDLVGLSLSAERHVDDAKRAFADIRRYSDNPDCAILAGGRILSEQPDLAAQLGADATAASGEEAVRLAHQLCPTISTV